MRLDVVGDPVRVYTDEANRRDDLTSASQNPVP